MFHKFVVAIDGSASPEGPSETRSSSASVAGKPRNTAARTFNVRRMAAESITRDHREGEGNVITGAVLGA
jgi:hypothetical protein